MGLNKWTLFLTNILNLWEKFISFVISKKFMLVFFLVLIFISFVLGFMFKYQYIKSELEFKHWLKVSQEQVQRQKIENKVKFIMSLYGSDSLIIFNSIMDTFDPILVSVVIGIESEYSTWAISSSNALGLMQVMPYHFKKGQQWNNPQVNIQVGATYLQELLKQFDGDKILALAAYNAGPGAVINSNYEIPDTKNNETRNYVLHAKKISTLVGQKL